MKDRRKFTHSNVHESFSDVALLMLATFIFLLVTILITSKVAEEDQLPRLKEQVAKLEQQLELSGADKERLIGELDEMAIMDSESQMDKVLEPAGLAEGEGRKDFEIFIEGLKKIPGKEIHLVIDATGSMHGASHFLIPVLRVIVTRSGKNLDAVTWFSDGIAKTYTGSMGEMFDLLMQGAPFIGNNETIGDAFRRAGRNARAPGAYLLIGDEPSDDRILYSRIKSPVFTLPLGRENPPTLAEYKTLAEKTGGLMLQMRFE
ncbi:MAG: hypothetical protein COB33_000915 [Thiotrichaceae bacterium]|nr:hypothetical protein [Thiotrichaceae bacterium]